MGCWFVWAVSSLFIACYLLNNSGLATLCRARLSLGNPTAPTNFWDLKMASNFLTSLGNLGYQAKINDLLIWFWANAGLIFLWSDSDQGFELGALLKAPSFSIHRAGSLAWSKFLHCAFLLLLTRDHLQHFPRESYGTHLF